MAPAAAMPCPTALPLLTATLSSAVSFLPKAWRRKRALRFLLGAMDGGSDGDEPRPIKRRSGTGTHGRVAGKKTLPEDADGRRGLGRHRRREACPPIPLRVDERRCRRDDSFTIPDAAGGGAPTVARRRRERGTTKRPARTFRRSETTTGLRRSTPEWASGHSASSTRSRVAPRNEKERVPAS
ncbi:hypothetical protein THAOC_03062 [Thalassiosira oceanica]|uniref:Uncharacterized protein n=1 Tax=Thalassiosira oceanica TaxID=159749 RepID=K0TQ08_THAOC|nr:hypothetical protein THAOC_03062 [Thalassiosira oceanica]|eukprot:EJK75222.1 hypothetical protein THAOC_03062 [Thalassiosira oceanica]